MYRETLVTTQIGRKVPMLKHTLNTNFLWGSSPLRSPIFPEIITKSL